MERDEEFVSVLDEASNALDKIIEDIRLDEADYLAEIYGFIDPDSGRQVWQER